MNNQRSRLWRTSLFCLVVLSGGCKDQTTNAPINHSPVITSIYAFPSHVQSSDSFIVVCSAYEPDGDSIFYDWFCSNGTAIQGAPPGSWSLYNTRENKRIFYAPDSSHNTDDSLRIGVELRDGKGSGTSGGIFVHLSR